MQNSGVMAIVVRLARAGLSRHANAVKTAATRRSASFRRGRRRIPPAARPDSAISGAAGLLEKQSRWTRRASVDPTSGWHRGRSLKETRKRKRQEGLLGERNGQERAADRKSTRLNSS